MTQVVHSKELSGLAPVFILLLLLLSSGLSLKAQELTRILFVLDASNSMNGKWQSVSKMDRATQLLEESLAELKGTRDLELALRVYGHQSPIASAQQDCDDTELMVPFGRYRYDQIGEAMRSIRAQGTTPIARSLERSADDFPDKDARNMIILITDGIEACDEDPCAVSLALQRKNIVLKPFVIGIGIDDEMNREAFECIGRYYNAGTEETFETVLNMVISQALDNTTVQVDLLDREGQPKESDVPMTFYDSRTGAVVDQFVHTINRKGLPDTLPLDPSYRYDITLHTIPSQKVLGKEIQAGKHTVIPIPAAQGHLKLWMDGRNAYGNLPCLVRKQGQQEVIHVQSFGTTERYLEGVYDLEILSLPRLIIQKVKINPNTENPVAIPAPGVLNLELPSSGYGCIQVERDSGPDWVCALAEDVAQQKIILQPGKYQVVYRSRNSKESIYTLERSFEIRSDSSTNIKL